MIAYLIPLIAFPSITFKRIKSQCDLGSPYQTLVLSMDTYFGCLDALPKLYTYE